MAPAVRWPPVGLARLTGDPNVNDRETDARNIAALEKQLRRKMPVSRMVVDSAVGVMHDSKGNVIGLSLHECGLGSIPECIFLLRSLRLLYLVGNRITSVPAEIGNLSELQKLDLWKNRLAARAIPPSIGKLKKLKKLYLNGTESKAGPGTSNDENGNEVKELPAEIGELESLELLSIAHNALESLPSTIGQLVKLQTLYVQGNQLPSLPESIGRLESLQTFDVSGNRLISLPESIGELISLQALIAGRNSLETIPASVGGMISLTELDASRNRLAQLGKEMLGLPALKRLDLSFNDLVSLPDPFFALGALKVLNARGNKLDRFPMLPPSIERVDFKQNYIASIPEDVQDFPSLKYMEMTGNPLDAGSMDVMQRLQGMGINTGSLFASIKKPAEDPFAKE